MSNTTDSIIEKLPNTAELKEDVKAASKSSLQSLRALVAGGVGGICAVVVGHPFDLVKVRMQTAEKGVYSGAMDVARKTIAKEGLARGLYAGVSAPLVGVTPMCKSSAQAIRISAAGRPSNIDANAFQLPSLSGATISASSWSRRSPRLRTISSASPKSQPPASSALSP
jgi:solute carrier family 25 carnitine/acylcarnitine transporter 20/29